MRPLNSLVYLILTLAVFFTSCKDNSNKQIKNERLLIDVNHQMQTKIVTDFKDAKPLMDTFAYSEYLVTKDFTAKNFKLTERQKESIQNHKGKGAKWTLKGTYKNYPLEKVVHITTYKKFPNTAYFQVQYINHGKKDLSIVKWVNNHYNLIPSTKDTTKFWSFQGSSHEDRRDWIQEVNPGTNHTNYMGMNASDYGGGIPVIDLWRKDAGIAIGQTDRIFRLVSLPVLYKENATKATVGVDYRFQNNKILASDDTLNTFETFVTIHQGDCFSPLRNYAQYMQTKGIIPPKSEPAAYEPLWCAWGYRRNFTPKEILNTLPKVKKLGFKRVGIDDGFYQSIGDWHTNKKTFPDGDKGMTALVDSIHSLGLRAQLWWNPIAVAPNSDFLKKNPHAILIQKDGTPQQISWWDAYYLSPTDHKVIATTKKTVELFIGKWGFDGLKLDGQNMNLCAPDYGKGHNISNPYQSFQQLPDFYKAIFHTAKNIDSNAVVEFCPCGTVMNFYIMPYTNMFVASDPTSSWQVRSKGLVYHALMPHTAYFGDHVELINYDFASQIGIGGVPGSDFVWPKIGTGDSKDFLLTPKRDSLYKKWIGLYNKMKLSKGKYMGALYDVGYDYPETHCIKKDGNMYYAFYNPHFEGKVELKGLDASKEYNVQDYFHDKHLASINGNHPSIEVHFNNFLMLKVSPK